MADDETKSITDELVETTNEEENEEFNNEETDKVFLLSLALWRTNIVHDIIVSARRWRETPHFFPALWWKIIVNIFVCIKGWQELSGKHQIQPNLEVSDRNSSPLFLCTLVIPKT